MAGELAQPERGGLSRGRLTQGVVPRSRSRRKTLGPVVIKPETRLPATETNATNRPSALIAAPPALGPSAWLPSEATLTRSTVPVARFQTKMSDTWFVSPATRLKASE